MKNLWVPSLLLLLAAPLGWADVLPPQASAATVYFKNLKDGQTIPSEYTLKFGVKGMAVEPAGKVAPAVGHHHLIVDGVAVPAGQPVPADATHIHFGKGQKDYKLKLPPGKHKLTLQFADGAHMSYGPEMSSSVTVDVK